MVDLEAMSWHGTVVSLAPFMLEHVLAYVYHSVCLQFNIPSWLQSHGPGIGECEQLLAHVSQGLNLCGPRPVGNHEILLEVS